MQGLDRMSDAEKAIYYDDAAWMAELLAASSEALAARGHRLLALEAAAGQNARLSEP